MSSHRNAGAQRSSHHGSASGNSQGGHHHATGGEPGSGYWDEKYGSNLDAEEIGAWRIPPGSINEGNIDPDGISGDVITGGTLPPTAFDTVPPGVPTALALYSDVVMDVSGASQVRLTAAYVQPPDPDLNGVECWITSESTGPSDSPVPDWTRAVTAFTGRESSVTAFVGVLGNTQYWVRVQAVDIQSNRSAWSPVATTTTVADTDPPGVPAGLVAVAGFKGALVRWGVSEVPDFAYYDLRYAVDNAGGTGPDVTQFVDLRCRSNFAWITGLTPGVRYWFEARAGDRSGNVSAYTADVVGETSCVPTQVGTYGDDIAAGSISTMHIATDGLDANVIKTGLLAIQLTAANRMDGVQVFDAAATTPDKVVGYWDESGLRIFSPSNKGDYLKISAGSVILYRDNVAVTAMTPDGIDASALRFGIAPGGQNLIFNSSFEIGSLSVDTIVPNTAFSLVTAVNVTNTGGAYTITALP